MAPVLRSLVLGDDPDAWRRAGLEVGPDGTAVLGGVRLELVGSSGDRGVLGWGFAGLPQGVDELDGIATSAATDPGPTPAHPGGEVAVDHVVVRTPDLGRTLDALAGVGLEVRRTRDVGEGDAAVRQAFVVAGTAVLEVVGPTAAQGAGPATCWGLALVVDDLAASATTLGEALGEPREAVQPGRAIATLRHERLGVSVPTALMTPRPGARDRVQ